MKEVSFKVSNAAAELIGKIRRARRCGTVFARQRGTLSLGIRAGKMTRPLPQRITPIARPGELFKHAFAREPRVRPIATMLRRTRFPKLPRVSVSARHQTSPPSTSQSEAPQ